MRITVLGWLAIFAVIAGVFLLSQSRTPGSGPNSPTDGISDGQD